MLFRSLGLLTTEDTIQQRGATRREELFECSEPNRPFDVLALLCLLDHAEPRLAWGKEDP